MSFASRLTNGFELRPLNNAPAAAPAQTGNGSGFDGERFTSNLTSILNSAASVASSIFPRQQTPASYREALPPGVADDGSTNRQTGYPQAYYGPTPQAAGFTGNTAGLILIGGAALALYLLLRD